MLFLLIVLIFLSILANKNSLNSISTPPDFYGTSKEVDADEFKDYLNTNNFSVYLPFLLPKNFEMTSIYLKENPFIAIVVYSAENNKDYKTAELTIQITVANSIPIYNELLSNVENPEYEKVYEINGWPIFVYERASSGSESSFIAKYGEFTTLTLVWIEKNQYSINSPTLNTDEVLILTENMILI